MMKLWALPSEQSVFRVRLSEKYVLVCVAYLTRAHLWVLVEYSQRDKYK
jgi:hypothetical protein